MFTFTKFAAFFAVGFLISWPVFRSDRASAEEISLRTEVKSVKMAHPGMRPEKLIVVYSSDNEGEDHINPPRNYVKQLAEILREINKKKRNPVELLLVSNGKDAEETAAFSRNYDFIHELVTLNELDRDYWAQDVGEFMFAQSRNATGFTPFLFDVNRKSGYDLGALMGRLAEKWDRDWFKLEEESDAQNYGGNIEAAPGDLLYLGENTTPALQSFFIDRGYADRSVTLNSSWLEVGHVDEFMSTIPLANDACGFAIVKADPALGLNLLRKLTEEEFKQVPEEYLIVRDWMEPLDFGAFMNARETWALEQYQLGNKAPWENHRHPDLTGKDRWFFQPQLKDPKAPRRVAEIQTLVGKIIDTNVSKVATKAESLIPGCQKVKVVSLPVMYSCWIDGQKVQVCSSTLPNFANMISLGTDNIVPDPFFPSFRKEIETTFASVGHRVHFIDTMMFQESKGNAHCVTNIVRDANVSVREWEKL